MLLTALTQIGGLVYLLSRLIDKKWKVKFRFKPLALFLAIYLFSTLAIVPQIAPLFGREKIENTKQVAPANWMTIVLNRNYVRPELNRLLKATSADITEKGIGIHYLDANFPFLNKFPLLPHLSHNDGKKLDICLIYETSEGVYSPLQKSTSGYGVFEEPKRGEINQTEKCLNTGYFQYDYPKYLTLGAINTDLLFSESGTKILINALLKNSNLEKMFIEPHLKQRLHLNDSRIRYHGCRAVRHDDHIHIQIR